MSRRRRQRKDEADSPHAGSTRHSKARSDDQGASDIETLVRCHLRFGWWSLIFFLLLGLLLESLHGFKVGWYVDASSTTRRHMWTLAHAHGTLLAVLNLILAGTIRLVPEWSPRHRRLASACLRSAAVLLPAGFFLGGCFVHDADPGIGILLVPIGAVLLVIAVLLAARSS